MTALKIVLAGLGVRGTYWAEVISRSDRCEVVAYADPNIEARQRAATRFGIKPAFETVEEALQQVDDVGALILANPPIGRESQVQAAVERGIPMLIEKPLALDIQEAANLVRIAKSGDVSLMVGLNFRYLGVTKATLALIKKGTVGQPEFARFTYERWRDGERPDLNKYPLDMAHPMLWEQSIHHFDLMRYIYGEEPDLVSCHTWNPSWSMYDDDTNVSAIFNFVSGLTINYQGTWQSNWAVPNFEWRTECTEGIITQRDQFGDLYYARRDDPELTPQTLPPHERWITDTSGLLDAFLAHVLDGMPLECSGEDHLASLAMVEACIQSSEEGTSVLIADVMPSV